MRNKLNSNSSNKYIYPVAERYSSENNHLMI